MEQQSTLITEINGIKYILFEKSVVDSSGERFLRSLSKELDCIDQGSDFKSGGLFGHNVLTLKILVPEKSVTDFNNRTRDLYPA